MRFDLQAYLEQWSEIRHWSQGQHGRDAVIDCPFCSAKKRLYANEETGVWICYRCEEKGALHKLVAVLQNLDEYSAQKEVRRLSAPTMRRSGSLDDIRAKRDRMEARAAALDAPCELPEEFEPVYDERTGDWQMPTYLEDRGVSPAQARRYGLGYCQTGRYAGRVILPAYCGGELRTFQARSTDAGNEIRYLGPVGARRAAVFGLDQAVDLVQSVLGDDSSALASTWLLVVEGAFDALRVVSETKRPAVALMGKAVTAAQVSLLYRAGFRRVVLMLDGHLWGNERDRQSIATAAGILGAAGLLDVRVARLAEHLDPGSASASEINVALQAAAPMRAKPARS